MFLCSSDVYLLSTSVKLCIIVICPLWARERGLMQIMSYNDTEATPKIDFIKQAYLCRASMFSYSTVIWCSGISSNHIWVIFRIRVIFHWMVIPQLMEAILEGLTLDQHTTFSPNYWLRNPRRSPLLMWRNSFIFLICFYDWSLSRNDT